jgi:hypothetical protein
MLFPGAQEKAREVNQLQKDAAPHFKAAVAFYKSLAVRTSRWRVAARSAIALRWRSVRLWS